MRQLGVQVAVFSLQVIEHRVGVAFLQPGIRVSAFGLVGNRGAAVVGG